MVERAVNGGAFAQLVVLGTSSISYTDNTVTPGTAYAHRVKAINATLSSIYSNTASVTLPAIPAAPTGLQASITSKTAIKLTWTDASNSETSFAIWRSDNGGAAVQVGTVNRSTTLKTATGGTVTYTSSKLSAGNTYTYYVTAVNLAGSSAPWSSVNVTFSSPVAPSGLSGIASVVSTPRDQVILTWTNKATNQTKFTIQRSTNGTNWSNISTMVAANATNYTQTNVLSSKTYYYRVAAVNGIGASAWSNIVTVVTP